MRLIDADALNMEILRRLKIVSPDVAKYTNGVLNFIANASTIEAEPVRHGRWVKRGQDIFCSECDEESGYTWAGASRYSDYCPNCGAKMDKED